MWAICISMNVHWFAHLCSQVESSYIFWWKGCSMSRSTNSGKICWCLVRLSSLFHSGSVHLLLRLRCKKNVFFNSSCNTFMLAWVHSEKQNRRYTGASAHARAHTHANLTTLGKERVWFILKLMKDLGLPCHGLGLTYFSVSPAINPTFLKTYFPRSQRPPSLFLSTLWSANPLAMSVG